MYLQSEYTCINLQKQKKTAKAVFLAVVIKCYEDVHPTYAWGVVLK